MHMIAFYPVTMVCEDLDGLDLEGLLPADFHMTLYEPGDELEWSRLQANTDSFATEKASLIHFQKEFGLSKEALKERCFFLTKDQQKMGSAMAWYGSGKFDRTYGRLHWVVIHPDFRGMGLGTQLIVFTIQQLRKWHSKGYLSTQTTSYPAINIYLNLGFRPIIENSHDEIAWRLLKDLLKHPALF